VFRDRTDCGENGRVGLRLAGRGRCRAGRQAPGGRLHREPRHGSRRTMRQALDLVAGLRLAERGTYALKGVPDEWRLFAVER
jgi:hypothetical protein